MYDLLLMGSYANQGGLWENQRKFTAKDPDFVGSININGEEVQIVGWQSSSTHPKAPTINLKVNAPVKFQQSDSIAESPAVAVKGDVDDIPF